MRVAASVQNGYAACVMVDPNSLAWAIPFERFCAIDIAHLCDNESAFSLPSPAHEILHKSAIRGSWECALRRFLRILLRQIRLIFSVYFIFARDFPDVALAKLKLGGF